VTGLTNAQLLFMPRGFGWTIVLSMLAFAGGGLLGRLATIQKKFHG
jgi:hypothetical protein